MTEGKALQLTKWITEKAIQGVGPLSSAEELVQEYLHDSSYESDRQRCQSLVRWETSKNFTSGFITGLGGVLTLPVAVPSALGASWVIQARMVAAIAGIYGHDIRSDRVRTLVLVALVGDSAKEVVKAAGVKVSEKVTTKLISKIPGRALIEINKRVGFRLLTKAGEKGVLNLTKAIPVVGGVVSGTVDAAFCRKVGLFADELFAR